jgi:hypothetical protein
MIDDRNQHHKMLKCPLRGHWASFRLVDEHGDGKTWPMPKLPFGRFFLFHRFP